MIFYIFAFCIGVMMAVQASINALLSKSLSGTPLMAGLISFVVGTCCLFALAYFYGALNASTIKALPHQEWWKYLGGILGALAILGIIILTPKIGLTNTFLLVVLGQILSSIVMDRYGVFGLPIREISIYKIIGLVVIFIGLGVFFYKDLVRN
ncbi:MAG: DMT family transporter [Campylobacter sp.]|nr:DMT family transporter [Campylobacter sp.]